MTPQVPSFQLVGIVPGNVSQAATLLPGKTVFEIQEGQKLLLGRVLNAEQQKKRNVNGDEELHECTNCPSVSGRHVVCEVIDTDINPKLQVNIEGRNGVRYKGEKTNGGTIELRPSEEFYFGDESIGYRFEMAKVLSQIDEPKTLVAGQHFTDQFAGEVYVERVATGPVNEEAQPADTLRVLNAIGKMLMSNTAKVTDLLPKVLQMMNAHLKKSGVIFSFVEQVEQVVGEQKSVGFQTVRQFPEGREAPIPGTLLYQCLQGTGKRVIITVPLGTESAKGIQSIVITPVCTGGTPQSPVATHALQAVSYSAAVPLDATNLEFVQAVANLIETAMVRERLTEQRLLAEAKTAIAKQLTGELFAATLGPISMDIPRAGLCIAGASIPADKEGGGDFYAALELGDGTVALPFGDVSGHGYKCALKVVAARRAYVDTLLQTGDCNAALRAVEQVLSENDYRFMSFLDSAYDPKNRTLRTTDYGHGLMLHFPASATNASAMESQLSSITKLKQGGQPIAIGEIVSNEANNLSLGLGDIVLQYTDGVPDLRCEDIARDEPFGHQRIINAVWPHRGDVKAMTKALLEALEKWKGSRLSDDDITFRFIQFQSV